MFNYLTGYSTGYQWRNFIVSPDFLQDRVLELIAREAVRAKAREGGRIFAKLNQLVDPEVIEALYKASQAGVKIDLLVRGSCCLRPGLKGISENIRVFSILDRFLEHSRVYVFGEGAGAEVYLASADWMPRNFRRRVEIVFPLIEPVLKQRVLEGLVPTYLGDNVKARQMQSDGSYRRVTPEPGTAAIRAQIKFLTEPPIPDFANEVSESA